MSTNDPLSFMPPDEPTAVYPIGSAKGGERPSAGALPEPPPLPKPDVDPPAPLPRPPQGGINPMVALLLIGFPVGVALCAVMLTALLMYLK